MKYKVLANSSLYRKLVEIQRKGEDANEICTKLASRLGFTSWYSDPGCVSGGIVAFASPTKPRGYTRLPGTKDAWIPNSKELILEMANAPRVITGDINTLVGLDDQLRCAQVYYIGDDILVAVPEDSKHLPVEGMEEILVSQFLNKVRSHGKYA